jgi:aryl-alcohol dehydrogenase-like predicted oxidoreductase
MRKRKLGNSDLEVPVIMLGGNVFGWTIDEAASFRVLDRAYDKGLTFIDTADVYSRWASGHTGGESEAIIGRWFARTGKRHQVIIATKVGFDMGNGNTGLSAKHIRKSVDDSLRRLQTDRIDLYQSHTDDQTVPLEETLGAYAELIRQGKVRYIGASNYKGARLREAMETSAKNNLPAYVSLQPQYNLMERAEFESDLLPVVNDYGLGTIPYYALASGFLSGKYRSAADAEGKSRGQGVKKYLNERGLKVLTALDQIAAGHSSTPAAVALAWLAAQPGITAPIASATSDAQVDDLAAAVKLVLSPAAVAALTAASTV